METSTSAKITEKNVKNALMYDNVVVLEYDLSVPEIATTSKAAAKRINRFYDHLLAEKQRYAEKVLFKDAVKHYMLTKYEDYPFAPYNMTMKYTVTWNQDEKLSLYYDVYEFTGGAHGNTVRYADNFSLEDGYPLPPLIPRAARKKVIRECVRQAQEQQAAGQNYFFDNIRVNMTKYFDPEQSYLVSGGTAVFYQLYTIAPYVSGIVSFVVEL